MLETIITEAILFLDIWVFFREHSRFTRQRGGIGGGYLFNISWGTNFLVQIICGVVILNWKTNDQIIWERSCINDKYIFQ